MSNLHASEATLLSKMKLLRFSYTFFLVLGHIQAIYCDCDATSNTDVLERAFGPVIATKLEGQSEEIKASIKLDSRFNHLQQLFLKNFHSRQSVDLSEQIVSSITIST